MIDRRRLAGGLSVMVEQQRTSSSHVNGQPFLFATGEGRSNILWIAAIVTPNPLASDRRDGKNW
jgi:hypothetical protein